MIEVPSQDATQPSYQQNASQQNASQQNTSQQNISISQQNMLFLPLRKHYGFAVFSSDPTILSHYLAIAAQLKQGHLNTYLTWFASAANSTAVEESGIVDQVVILPGEPIDLEQAVERLRDDRPWVGFYPAAPSSSTGSPSKSPNGIESFSPLRSPTPCPSLPASSAIAATDRIVLGQLGLNGDCLYATTLARQIKHDFPGCHLTWAISSFCRSIIEENPYVDEIWEIPATGWKQIEATWHWLAYEVQHQLDRGRFTHAFLTQVYPYNLRNFDGTVRPSIFRNYPGQITVPVQNILRLRDAEVAHVRSFADRHQLAQYHHVILFEYSSSSAQCYLDLDYALTAAKTLVHHLPNCLIIMSSHKPIPEIDPRIIDASSLSLRENAELTKYCHLFIGCSSGITQIALTDWAKPLPMIQLLASATSVYASIAHDFEYWGLSTDRILEMADAPVQQLIDCVKIALTEGFSQARRQFHQTIPLHFEFYLTQIRGTLLYPGQYAHTAEAISHAVQRYGWHPQLKAFVQNELFPLRAMQTTLPVGEEDLWHFLHSCMQPRQQAESLPELNFAEVNLIAFPDWQQPLDLLATQLRTMLRGILTHPQAAQVAIFLTTNTIDPVEADRLLAGVVMDLLMGEELSVEAEPAIVLLPWLSEQQWQLLLPYFQARVPLEYDDAPLVASLASHLPILTQEDKP
jgi:ADP-heptose:LPS heptosyltransferase